MTNKDYTTTVALHKPAAEVFKQINNVTGWWTENLTGQTQQVDDEFTVTFGKTWIRLKVFELAAGNKVVWQVTDCFKHFLKNKKEWAGTEIHFDITTNSKQQTVLTFTHKGLASPLECYDVCCDAWNGYLQRSLKNLITTGTGNADKKG